MIPHLVEPNTLIKHPFIDSVFVRTILGNLASMLLLIDDGDLWFERHANDGVTDLLAVLGSPVGGLLEELVQHFCQAQRTVPSRPLVKSYSTRPSSLKCALDVRNLDFFWR